MHNINKNPEIIQALRSGDKFIVEFKGVEFTASIHMLADDFSEHKNHRGKFYVLVEQPEIEQSVVIFTKLRPVGLFRKISWEPFTLDELSSLIINGDYCVV